MYFDNHGPSWLHILLIYMIYVEIYTLFCYCLRVQKWTLPKTIAWGFVLFCLKLFRKRQNVLLFWAACPSSTCPPLPQAGCSGAINPEGYYITKQKYTHTKTPHSKYKNLKKKNDVNTKKKKGAKCKDAKCKKETNTRGAGCSGAINPETNYITIPTSSQKLRRWASRRVCSIWKSLGRVSFGSKKFGTR